MHKNDFTIDDCPLCLLMKKADEINRLSARHRRFGGALTDSDKG